jgi:hypothetical protein
VADFIGYSRGKVLVVCDRRADADRLDAAGRQHA